MANHFVISVLVRKRFDLTVQIDAIEHNLSALYRDIDHIDATLRKFDPDTELDAIKPRRQRREKAFFKHGQLARLVLSAVRAHGPLATDGVARCVTQVMALECDEKALFSDIVRRVGYALADQRKLGRIESEQGAGRSLMWRVKRYDYFLSAGLFAMYLSNTRCSKITTKSTPSHFAAASKNIT